MAMVVLVQGTKSSRLSKERRGRRDVAEVGSRMASQRYLGATPIWATLATALGTRDSKNSNITYWDFWTSLQGELFPMPLFCNQPKIILQYQVSNQVRWGMESQW